MEADFPKDEETVPVSTRACKRLIAVLAGLGVDPVEKVNPVDAAALILEGIAEAVLRLNVKSKKPEREHACQCPTPGSGVSCQTCGAGIVDPDPEPRQLKVRCGCTVEVPFKPEVGTSYRCSCGKITVVYEGTETAMIPVSYWAPDESFFTEPTEEELEALDEVTHATSCRIWNENEETDCDCYDHGGEG